MSWHRWNNEHEATTQAIAASTPLLYHSDITSRQLLHRSAILKPLLEKRSRSLH